MKEDEGGRWRLDQAGGTWRRLKEAGELKKDRGGWRKIEYKI